MAWAAEATPKQHPQDLLAALASAVRLLVLEASEADSGAGLVIAVVGSEDEAEAEAASVAAEVMGAVGVGLGISPMARRRMVRRWVLEAAMVAAAAVAEVGMVVGMRIEGRGMPTLSHYRREVAGTRTEMGVRVVEVVGVGRSGRTTAAVGMMTRGPGGGTSVEDGKASLILVLTTEGKYGTDMNSRCLQLHSPQQTSVGRKL